ncbi:hypothetical protein BYT27DRAFT_7181136 [Phlegmacium glaucopus]|nr:hypothetical protein BYT27DRAFT_7181136 [Phlegmacium glaucopus]
MMNVSFSYYAIRISFGPSVQLLQTNLFDGGECGEEVLIPVPIRQPHAVNVPINIGIRKETRCRAQETPSQGKSEHLCRYSRFHGTQNRLLSLAIWTIKVRCNHRKIQSND